MSKRQYESLIWTIHWTQKKYKKISVESFSLATWNDRHIKQENQNINSNRIKAKWYSDGFLSYFKFVSLPETAPAYPSL